MNKVNLANKFSQIREYWSPHIAGELNGQMVKLVQLKGEFVWHHHENEDELFLVVKGRFCMEYREAPEQNNAGEGAHSGASFRTAHQGEGRTAGDGNSADKSVRATQNGNSAGALATRTLWIEEGEFIICAARSRAQAGSRRGVLDYALRACFDA